MNFGLRQRGLARACLVMAAQSPSGIISTLGSPTSASSGALANASSYLIDRGDACERKQGAAAAWRWMMVAYTRLTSPPVNFAQVPGCTRAELLLKVARTHHDAQCPTWLATQQPASTTAANSPFVLRTAEHQCLITISCGGEHCPVEYYNNIAAALKKIVDGGSMVLSRLRCEAVSALSECVLSRAFCACWSFRRWGRHTSIVTCTSTSVARYPRKASPLDLARLT